MKALLLKFAKSRFTAIVTELELPVSAVALLASVVSFGALMMAVSWFKIAFVVTIVCLGASGSTKALSTLRSWALKAEQEAVATATAAVASAGGASPSP